MRTYRGLVFAAAAAAAWGFAIIERRIVRCSVPVLRLCALGALLALALGASPAAAQFICGTSANGGEPQDGNTNTVAGNGVACGAGNNATGSGAAINVAVGNQTNASGNDGNNLAVGFLSNASGLSAARNVAVGAQAAANGQGGTNIAIGSTSAQFGLAAPNAAGDFSQNIAIGTGTNASGGLSGLTFAANIAVGTNANASGTGTRNVAIGANSAASNESVAYGSGAVATGATSTALGNTASATFANSAAFGSGATATRANQQAFGTGVNTYTMGGIASAASRAAQTGTLQFVTSDANGNLATQSAGAAGLASTADISAINAGLEDLNGRINTLTTESRRGIAATAALTSAVMPSAPGRTTFSINGSVYRSEAGIGVGFAHRLNAAVPLIVHGSYGNGGGSEHVGRLGVTVEF